MTVTSSCRRYQYRRLFMSFARPRPICLFMKITSTHFISAFFSAFFLLYLQCTICCSVLLQTVTCLTCGLLHQSYQIRRPRTDQGYRSPQIQPDHRCPILELLYAIPTQTAGHDENVSNISDYQDDEVYLQQPWIGRGPNNE